MATSKTQKFILGFMTLVILATSVYVLLPENVKITVGQTYTTLQVYENKSWVLAGQEYSLLYNGTKKMLANSRNITTQIEGNTTIITRTANFSEGAQIIDTYYFDGNLNDVEMYPVSHTINVINGKGKILVYEVTKLGYEGPTISDVKGPLKFLHRTRVEWEEGNYYSKLLRLTNKSEGKLTIKYKIDSDDFIKSVRLLDPMLDLSHTEFSKEKIDTSSLFIRDNLKSEFGSVKVISDETKVTLAEYAITGKDESIIDLALYGVATLHYSSKLFEDAKFKDISGSYLDSSVAYYLLNNKSYIESEIASYKEVCSTPDTKSINKTISSDTCVNVPDTYKNVTKYKSEWIPYNYTYLKAGDYSWKAEFKRDIGQKIDIIPIAQGKELKEFTWFNNSWLYKREVKILEKSGENLYNYSVPINVTYSSGMNVDFSDLRFTNSTENGELGYWIEDKVNSTWAYIWIKVINLTASSNTSIYMYYGNSEVSSTSNISNAFYWVDNDDASYTEKVDSNSKCTISDGGDYRLITFTANSDCFYSPNIVYPYAGISIKSSLMSDKIGQHLPSLVVSGGSSTSNLIASGNQWSNNKIDLKNKIFSDATFATVSATIASSKYFNLTMNVYGKNVTVFGTDTSGNYFTQSSTAGTKNFSASNEYFGVGSVEDNGYSSGGNSMFKYPIIVRNFVYSEPTYTIGDEQQNGPIIILNSPINAYNSSSSTIIFNSTVTSGNEISNVSIYLDGVLNETNSSGINATDYLFTKTLSDGSHNWSIQSCNTNACTNSSTRIFTIDTVNPSIIFNNPINSGIYNTTLELLNLTISDTNLDKTIYNWNGTNDTYTTPVNITFLEGFNTINVWANDSSGNVNYSNITFMINPVIPIIIINNPANYSFSNLHSLLANITVFAINPNILTIRVYNESHSLFSSTTLSSSSGYTYNTYNFTNVPYGKYYINATINNTAGTNNSTETRMFYLTEIFLTTTGSNYELKTGENISSGFINVTDINICLDLPNSILGRNIICNTSFSNYSFNLSQFRNTLFSDGNTTSNLTFTYINDTTYNLQNFSIPVHQYDEIDNISVNISGYTTGDTFSFYSVNNTSSFDRAYYGNLIGNLININKLYQSISGIISYLTQQNLTFTSAGEKLVYFYMDKDSKFNNLTLNLTGMEAGFEYNEDFHSNEYEDLSSTAHIKGGMLTPGGINPAWFTYDNYSDSSINTTLWETYANGHYHPDGDYEWDIANSESTRGLYLGINNFGPYDYGSTVSDTASNYAYTNISHLNYMAGNSMLFNISGSVDASEDKALNDCNWNNILTLGGTQIFNTHHDRCWRVDSSGNDLDCNEGTEIIEPIIINVTKNLVNSWNVKITGTERTYYQYQYKISGTHNCGYCYEYYNYTSGVHSYICDNPSAGSNCVHVNSTVTNNFDVTISGIASFTDSPSFYQTVSGSYHGVDNYGCISMDSGIYLGKISQELYNITNSTFYSKSVYNSEELINTADSAYEYLDFTHNSSNIATTISASSDGGSHYQPLINGTTFFSNPGSNLIYKISFTTPTSGYFVNIPFWYYLNISTEKDFPSDVSLDLGNDGTPDYTFAGYMNNTTSPVTVNIPTADLTNSFIGNPVVGQTYLIPLSVTSSTVGKVIIDNINFTYNPNPIYLNKTKIQAFLSSIINFGHINLTIGAINGTINLTDLRYDYAGGNKTYNLTAHTPDYGINVTKNLTYYYSRWDYEFVPSGIEWILFSPRTPTSKNVTPDGQSLLKPILNITNYGYGGKNAILSVLQDEESECVNTTISLDNNKSNGFLLTDSFQDLTTMSYLQNKSIWLWADYNCTYSTWKLYQPNLYFRQCVDGGVCTTEVI